MSVIDQIKSQASLLERVIQQVRLRQRGDEWWGCCPFHQEKTPSFSVRSSGDCQVYHCLACGESGSVIDWVMHVNQVDQSTAIRLLANELGLAPENRHAPLVANELQFVSEKDLPAMRIVLQAEFESLATKLDTCLRDIQRLAPRTDNIAHELIAERETEKAQLETQLTTFFQRIGFLTWPDWWRKYSDALFSDYTEQISSTEWRGHSYRAHAEKKRTNQYGLWEWQEYCRPDFNRPLTEEESAYLWLIHEAAEARKVHPLQITEEWERKEPERHDDWPTDQDMAEALAEERRLNG